MPRKTARARPYVAGERVASMRPRPDAAENGRVGALLGALALLQ